MNTTNRHDSIIVPAIDFKGAELKPEQEYEVGSWIDQTITKGIDAKGEVNGFEGEGFTINNDGELLVFNEGFEVIESRTKEDINRISNMSSNEELLNQEIQSFLPESHFGKGMANLTQELFLPSVEISLGKGFSIGDLLPIVIESYGDLIDYLKSQDALYLPSGIYPIKTENVNNLANDYYKYLFSQRDGFSIGDFRGAGLQLHKMAENYDFSVFLFNKIRHVLPVFQILSQNSPIKDGIYSGNLSERTISKFDWKMSGIPDSIDENFISELQDWVNSSIKSVTPYYYAVRYPRVDIKTIENTSMDTVSDIYTLMGIIDLYYRITEKLKIDYLEGNPLPPSIFGKDSGSSIETNVIRENFNKAIRFGTTGDYHIMGGKDSNFEEILEELYKYIGDIPCQIPSNLIGSISEYDGKADIGEKIIFDILKSGNLAEKCVKEMGLKYNRDSGEKTMIPEYEIRQYMLMESRVFTEQIQNILNNTSTNVKSRNNSSFQTREHG